MLDLQGCLIVDDEIPARQELLYILNNIEGVKVVGEASHGMEALELNRKLKPDIMFLDIQMPEMSGMDVARILLGEEHKPMVIFVTAYDQFAIEAFEVNAVDYLLKPISEERLRNRLKKISLVKEKKEDINYEKLSKMIQDIKLGTKVLPNIVSVYHNNKLIPIEIKDIIYATIEEKNTIIVTDKGKFEINCTLNKLLERLDSSIFFRSHKSYIVNLKSISSVEPWFNATYNINLKDDLGMIPVSRSYAKAFREIMNIE